MLSYHYFKFGQRQSYVIIHGQEIFISTSVLLCSKSLQPKLESPPYISGWAGPWSRGAGTVEGPACSQRGWRGCQTTQYAHGP